MRGHRVGMLPSILHGDPVLPAMLHRRVQGCGADMREVPEREERDSGELLLIEFNYCRYFEFAL